MPGHLYADDLVLFGGPEGDGETVCRGMDKVNVVKRKVMILNGDEGLECELHINRI